MGTLRFNLPRSGRPVGEILTKLPRAFRDDAEKGFGLLANVSESHYEEIIQHTIVMIDSRRPPIEELGRALGLTPVDTGAVVAAAMLVVPIFGEGTEAEEFLNAATKVKLFDQALVPKLRPFVNKVASHTAQIATVIKKATLTDQVLPSFVYIDVAVDVRLGFAEGRVDIAAPVALVYIDTDADNKELWFQCSKQQLHLIREEIETALKKMDAAEAWVVRN
jgi:hypothetical protein